MLNSPVSERVAVLERRFDDHMRAEAESHSATLELIEKVEDSRVSEHRDTLRLIEKIDARLDVSDIRNARLMGGFAAVTSAIAIALALGKALGVIP